MRKHFAVIAMLLAGLLLAPAAAHAQQAQVTGLNIRIVRDTRIDGRRLAILQSDWLYCYPPTGDLILVPRGYVTDFASIPVGVRNLIDVYGDNIEAAVAHDWLYAVGEPGQRQFADKLFRHALKEQGVGLATRNAMYKAVRTGGEAGFGRPDEWDHRFGDPETGLPLPSSPYRRRSSAVVAKLPFCASLERPEEIRALLARHGSASWARTEPPPP